LFGPIGSGLILAYFILFEQSFSLCSGLLPFLFLLLKE
jgi:hypothetical protein